MMYTVIMIYRVFVAFDTWHGRTWTNSHRKMRQVTQQPIYLLIQSVSAFCANEATILLYSRVFFL